eukprot:EG_transcript_13957
MQETAERHRHLAQEWSARDLLSKVRGHRGRQISAALASLPFLVPAAALAHGGVGDVPLTPDLVAGFGATVWMVSQGQYVMDQEGGHVPHGPPEPPSPLDVSGLAYPDTPDGAALAETFAKPYDIWRESLVRYIAYSSELGEACRPVIGDTFANATYGIAIAYVFADSIDKVFRGSELSRELSAAAVFLQMDQILNGRLEMYELHDAAEAVKAPITDEEMAEFLKRADIRTDDSIDFEEFYLALKRRDPTLLRFLEAGAQSLPPEAARPWSKALQEWPDLSDVRTAVAGLDALLWQMLASIAMPGFALNRIVTLAEAVCGDVQTALGTAVDPSVLMALEYVPTVIGLLSIAVIVHPLDTLADEFF